jgi:tetratricopeptide (TPR) repeat protein
MKRLIQILSAGLLLSFCVACATSDLEYKEGQSSKQYFRKAQEAEVQKNPVLAIKIYNLIIEHFKDEAVSVYKAQYEKGRLSYYAGNIPEAKTCFETVLSMRDADPSLPEGIAILTRKFIEKIKTE